MARPKRRAAASVDYPIPPPELAERLWVEDWLSAGEIAAHALTAACPACPQPTRAHHDIEVLCQMTLLLVARRRHRGERRAWLEAHSVPRQLECRLIPSRRPTFRDGSS